MLAARVDCWPALCGGVLLGDAVGHRFDPAQRAILGLAAFGTAVGWLGRELLGRLAEPGRMVD